MALKENLQYKAFLAFFSVWFVSLIVVYIPISKWITPTFPLTIDYNYKLIIFSISATLSALTSFYIGLNKMRGDN